MGAAAAVKGVRGNRVFANWHMDENGDRIPVVYWGKDRKDTADLIYSYYWNRQTKRRVCSFVGFDLDASRAIWAWKDEHGALDWSKIGAYLEEEHYPIFQRIFAAPRSASGRGIHLLLGISPVPLAGEDELASANENLARYVQKLIFNVLEHIGLGPDPAALGLARPWRNYLAEDAEGDIAEFVLRGMHRRDDKGKRESILSDLKDYCETLPCARGHKKSNPDLLHTDRRVEKKAARLYLYLFNKDDSYTADLTKTEVQRITGMSPDAVSRMIDSPRPWLKTEYVSHKDGWRCQLVPTGTLTCRAESLVDDKPPPPGRIHNLNGPLCQPHEVEDGERNLWISKATIWLKHAGIDEERALGLMRQHVRLIPQESKPSRNVKSVAKIVRNIYEHKKEFFGVNPARELPEWLVGSPSLMVVSEAEKKVEIPVSQAVESDQKKVTTTLLKPQAASLGFAGDGCLLVDFEGVVTKVVFSKPGWAVFSAENSAGETWKIVGQVHRREGVQIGSKVMVSAGRWDHIATKWPDVYIHEFHAERVEVTGFDVSVALTVLPGLGRVMGQRLFEKFGAMAWEAIRSGQAGMVCGVGPGLLLKWQKALGE